MNVQYSPFITLDPQQESRQCERVQRIIEQAITDGCLSRDQDDDILAAITADRQPSAAVCGLFRCLQERVWQAELVLEN